MPPPLPETELLLSIYRNGKMMMQEEADFPDKIKNISD